ncbi:transposase [Escherichia coli]|nr:transposase [Escherichia coli]EET5526492.1 transposase [Escherichia coli]EEU0348636.1 transposase [Escherichia coli]EEV0324493.1 transposase [Escherichia coli]EEV2035824.1 transposase [Escherichia coli]
MIKTRRAKRTFSPEFKLEAIEQVVKYLRDVREVALALELNPDHLCKWIRLYKQELQGIEPAGNAITPEQREIQQLEAQIAYFHGRRSSNNFHRDRVITFEQIAE